MPLLVQKDQSYTDFVLPDLLRIVDGDTSIGDKNTPDPAWVYITYDHPKTGFAQKQLFDVINGTPNYNILLRYLPSTDTLPEKPPITIATVAGATYGPGDGTANPVDSGVILVYVDAYRCGGSNFWVRGADGSKIFYPRWVCLFHELSHALHIARGQVTPNTPQAQEDALTIGDENKLRAQYQSKYPWLKQRSPNEEGGCGATDPDQKVNNPTSKSCLIVTAAYGSPHAREVDRFRRVRDELVSSCVLTDAFFAHFTAEYYRFSPDVATAMIESEALKSSVARFVVEPLLAFFTLLELYLDRCGPQKDFWSAGDAVLMPLLAGMRRQEFPFAVDSYTHGVREHLKLVVDSQRKWGMNGGGLSPDEMDSDAREVIQYLIGMVNASASRADYVNWALAEPTVICWSWIGRLKRSSGRASDIAGHITETLDDWLVAVPIPAVFGSLDEAALLDSLAKLARTVFKMSNVRHRLGSRLLEACGAQVSYDLEKVLQDAQYLPRTW